MNNTKWDLDELLPLNKFDETSTQLVNDLKKFTDLFSSIINPINLKTFSELIESYIKITEIINIIYARAYLAEELNNIGEEEVLLKTKATNLLIEFQNTIRPFVHWLKGMKKVNDVSLNDEFAKILFSSIPELEYHLLKLRKLNKHTLSMKEEQIIIHKDLTGLQTLLDLRNIIENEQIYTAKINNKIRIFNNSSELSKYFKDENKENRENSYNELYKVYGSNLLKYFSIYRSVVKDWTFEAKLRNYNSNISIRNLSNDIKDSTVNLLLDTCQANKDIFNRYFDLKARELKLKSFSRYDIYAPIHEKSEQFEYKDGIKVLKNVFKEFDDELFKICNEFFDQKHIDVFPSDTKKAGAFCANVTNRINPYLLLNYTNTIRDVFIMAHEFGHATHYILSNNNSVLTQDAPLTLAETASTFTENIVFDFLYKNEKDKNIKKGMLFNKIGDAYATISRQAYFVLFEQEAHNLLNQGIKMEDFNSIYLQNLKSQFQGHVEVPDIFKYEWSYIPHLVNTPFYCYAYSFGNLLAFSLYEQYLENDGSFINKYKNILKAGGSKDPYKLLKTEGFDIDDPEFFNSGFKLINKWVGELEKLI